MDPRTLVFRDGSGAHCAGRTFARRAWLPSLVRAGLATAGVPTNLMQRGMGQEQASTTPNRYTHTPDD